VNCILQWSLCKEWCPQCKHPFDYLLTHKQLDGTVTDFLTEESVVLLKRARWFEEYMRVSNRHTPRTLGTQLNSSTFCMCAAMADGNALQLLSGGASALSSQIYSALLARRHPRLQLLSTRL